jgi:hypothetical protein
MAKQQYSDYQKKVIDGYYGNLDTIMLGKIGELITELYLADTPQKKENLWKRVAKAMAKLKVPTSVAEHILKSKNVVILAKNFQDWQKLKK